MHKLYYSPGACSLSPHVALREVGIPFDLEKVDLREKKTASGADYRTINPKGYVPALALDDGRVLTEGVAIIQYLADLAPELHLAPPCGTFERVRFWEWLNFIATELHKAVSPLYRPQATEDLKQFLRERVTQRLAYMGQHLEKNTYLMGERFTVADGYAYYTLRTWTGFLKAELPTQSLVAYFARVGERPSVKAALVAEGFSR
ncbi:MAG TPA: glutathione transferase GstA [Polyangiaceae bacterium]|nr:glutathione transferase GstA [Polyangiaceae bacterium]